MTDPAVVAVRLATDVAAQFRHRPATEAAAAVAAHIRSFWDPRMRRSLLVAVSSRADGDVDPVVRAAAAAL